MEGDLFAFVFTSLVFVAFLIEGSRAKFSDCSEDCEKISIKTTSMPCSNIRDTIEDMKTLNQTTVSQLAICVTKCHLDAFCSLAIFAEVQELTCLLMSNFYGEKTNVPFTLDHPKCKAFSLDSARCKNCGTPDIISCTCLNDYYGRFCEFNKPLHCNIGQWEIIGPYPTSYLQRVAKSNHPLKTNVMMAGGYVGIYTSYNFRAKGLGFWATPEPVMDVNYGTADFIQPWMAFHLFKGSVTYLSLRVPLNDLDDGLISSLQYHVYHFEFVNSANTPVKYDGILNIGNPRDIINGLRQGHRLMSMSPIQVHFDPNSDSTAYIMRAINQPQDTGTSFVQPLEISGLLMQTLHTGEKFEALYRLGQGIHEIKGSNESRTWEMDDCWYAAQPVKNESEIIDLIREAALRGQEIRVLIGDTISSDVLQVSVTDTDVAVELTSSFTPPSATAPFQVDSRIVRMAISMSKMKSTCESELGKPDAFFSVNGQYTDNVKWFIGSAQLWKLLFQNLRIGSQFSLSAMIGHARSNKDMRVCVEHNQLETLCLSPNQLIHSSTRVLFHSRPFIKLSFDEIGKFQGFSDSACRLTEYLISSDGFIRSVSYALGGNATNYESAVPFNSISWFGRTLLPPISSL